MNKNPIHELFGIDLSKYGDLNSKIVHDRYLSVDPNNETPFPVELDDLIRLHSLVTSRRVTTIIEFGIGKSTLVFDDALRKNENEFGPFVKENLRRSNPFELHSVENNLNWIEATKKNFPNLSENSFIHHCPCEISTFNGRICTFYNNIPNVCPDFIYLDGPDQFSPAGEIRGINTNHPDRLPMAADILSIEHFLLPGTLLVVDGRAANARFLKSNLQRDWQYDYVEEYDQHFFEMKEPPLGVYNKQQIEFCLGSEWLKEVS
ncbi:hypothetical protein OAL04_05010 [Nitrospinae bacterium]|nr:hypothetical protein [Nitrospinota bacterium]